MDILDQLNGSGLYLVCGGIIAVIAVICVIFLVRAWKAGKALGMDPVRMRRAVTSSATFTVLPAAAILLGVIALSGSLGLPWPWLRLSVIGALHYETQVASAAAEQSGIRLGPDPMTASAFSTVALLMSVCIMWGMVLAAVFNKKYVTKLQGKVPDPAEKKQKGGFGDLAMVAMFIGMVSAYLGSYLGAFTSGNGLFTFSGDWLPLLTAAASALAMAGFTFLAEKKKMEWLDNFSIAGSMLIGMVAAALAAGL